MRNILKIIFLLMLTVSTRSFAQLDTLNYLKQFEVNKANYIGHSFSKLLNDMTQIKPKAAWPSPNFVNKKYNYHTTFSFCDIEFSFYNTILLRIEWENPIPANSSEYYIQLNHFHFSNDEKIFYGSKIVKDIKVYR